MAVPWRTSARTFGAIGEFFPTPFLVRHLFWFEETEIAMPRIFLAHSSVDKRFARRLCRALADQGIDVWIDEAEMQVGDSLIEKLGQAIVDTEYLAVVMTPHSVESRWVRKELEVALSIEIESGVTKVLPILYKECEVPPFLRGKVWADFSKPASFTKGVDAIARRLSLQLRIGDIEPWSSEGIDLGVKIGMLKEKSGQVEFSEEFLEHYYQRSLEVSLSDYHLETRGLRVTLMLAALDMTPFKLDEENLVVVVNGALRQSFFHFTNIALKFRVLKYDGGYTLSEPFRQILYQLLPENPPKTVDEFDEYVLEVIEDALRSWLLVHAPQSVQGHRALATVVTVIWQPELEKLKRRFNEWAWPKK